MEWLEALKSLVSDFGFPIAMCVAMFWKMSKQDEVHKEELNGLRDSLDRNTEIITRLYEKMQR